MDAGSFSTTLVLLVLLALAFDFMNGFHDAANSIATVVSTGVLKPWQAVIWAAFFNVLAWAVFHLSVAATVGKGIIDPSFVDNRLIFGALIGAISWNLITWYYGIPSSSSHALIGGMIGAALVKGGVQPLLWPGILSGAMLAFIISLDDFVITFFVSGAGATTLPIYIYGMIRIGVTPEVNAISALMLLISIVFVALSWVVGRARS